MPDDLKNCEYFLVEYAPTALRDTRVSIGLFLFEASGRLVRHALTRDWRQLRCLDPQADVRLLESLPEYFDQLVGECAAQEAASGRTPAGAGLYEQLRRMQENYSGALRISLPRGVRAANPEEEFALKARAHHFWRLPNTEDVRQGYGEITDDGSGCVAVETFYVQHLSSGQTRRAVSPTQHLSSGVGISFINSDECDTGVAIIGNGESVSLEAVDWDGETLGQADLGNIFHTSFLLSERLPVVKNHLGTVQINGNVSALSLEFCNGNLAQSRWAHPVPGAQVVVVSFEAKRIGDGVLARHKYAYKLILRNPTQTDQAYEVDLLFRDADGFVVKRVPITGSCNSYDFNCSRESFLVSAGQTRTFEDTANSVSFNPDPEGVPNSVAGWDGGLSSYYATFSL